MNSTATKIDQYSVSLTRDVNAPIEKVFRAWTDPDILTKWFGPKEVTTRSAQVDLKVGGKYQLVMEAAEGKIHTIGGAFREIDPPRKLVFTWILDPQGCEGSDGFDAETLVTLEFQDLGAATRIALTHDFLPSEKSKESHQMGWIGSFDCLETVLD